MGLIINDQDTLTVRADLHASPLHQIANERARLGGHAVLAAALGGVERLIGALDYHGAATCEFLVDAERGTYGFLEINARLQVEHPVTEMVTGVDVVREQLRIAGGEGLSFEQEDVRVAGHSVEVRVNAESPERGFAPSPGTLRRWVAPVGTGVRVDTAIEDGLEIPPYYDSLIAKVIVSDDDRPAAIARAVRALEELEVEGIPTTRELALDVLRSDGFAAGDYSTGYLDEVERQLPSLRPA